jgi:hypothetical protein
MHYEFFPQGQTVNQQFYNDSLHHLQKMYGEKVMEIKHHAIETYVSDQTLDLVTLQLVTVV